MTTTNERRCWWLSAAYPHENVIIEGHFDTQLDATTASERWECSGWTVRVWSSVLPVNEPPTWWH